MLISLEPTISGGFVHHVMDDPEVAKLLREIDVSPSDKHNLTKAILIAGLRDFEYDVNQKIMQEVSKRTKRR